jgi:hypothetical protein
MIDFWKLTKDFAVGDRVQQVIHGTGLTPFVGRVLAVMPGIGFVDVQWPFGTERVSPEDLVRMNDTFSPYLPPSVTFSYFPGYDVTKTAAAGQWRTTEVPPGFHRELAKLYYKGASEVKAYDELWHRFASFSDDASVRDEVSKFYRFAFNACTMYVEQFARRTAVYWAAQNRQHRATRSEVEARCPNCPRCGKSMRKATYKMDKGAKMRLFACPKDLFLIKQTDILGPEGQPVEW